MSSGGPYKKPFLREGRDLEDRQKNFREGRRAKVREKRSDHSSFQGRRMSEKRKKLL